MKKVPACLITAVFASICFSTVDAADRSPAAKHTTPPVAAANTQAVQKTAAPASAKKSNFSMVLGSVSRIDNTDPANVKIEVKDSSSDQTHIFELSPRINVTKVTDISELKTGDKIRVMARGFQDKEVAMGIMFGNIEALPNITVPVRAKADASQKATPPTPKAAKKK